MAKDLPSIDHAGIAIRTQSVLFEFSIGNKKMDADRSDHIPSSSATTAAAAMAKVQQPIDIFDIFGSDSSDEAALLAECIPKSPVLWKLVKSNEKNGGQGLRATAHIKQGTEIHRESPALR